MAIVLMGCISSGQVLAIFQHYTIILIQFKFILSHFSGVVPSSLRFFFETHRNIGEGTENIGYSMCAGFAPMSLWVSKKATQKKFMKLLITHCVQKSITHALK
jgi:hypothetical protein